MTTPWRWGLVNVRGEFVIAPEFRIIFPFSSEGLALARNDQEQRFFIDRQGKRAFDQTFDEAHSFTEGLASVEKDGQYGYIDAEGRLRIPFAFDYAHPFKEGRAVVKVGKLYGYIDREGRYVVQPKYLLGKDFTGGRACVWEPGEDWGYIDHRGSQVIPQIYEHAEDFQNGLAAVYNDEFHGFIDPQGRRVIEAQGWGTSSGFSEGVCPCTPHDTEGLCGYIDHTGRIVIPGAFDFAGEFSEGLADIKVDGKWGYIDRTGHYVIAPQYESAQWFSEGLAWVKRDGRSLCIDHSGRKAFDQTFLSGEYFRNGVARVCVSAPPRPLVVPNKSLEPEITSPPSK